MSAENSPQQCKSGGAGPFGIVLVCALALAAWSGLGLESQHGAAAPQAAKKLEPAQWQMKVLEAQRAEVAAAREKVRDISVDGLAKLNESAEKSKSIQQGLEKLILDLLEAAKTDPDAAAIVKKYNIQQSATPPAPAEAPSATPGN